MRQRTSLACALAHRPRVLLLDEPTVGVDPQLRATFWSYFRSLASSGVTLIVSSHVMDEAERCDRLGFMRQGRLLAEGSAAELRERKGTRTLIIAVMAVVGVNLGILASAFARTEFQVLQFIPLVIFPQVLLGGTFWAVSDMPAYLRPLAHVMPIYYANTALRDVMLKGWGLAEIWPNLAILVGIGVVLVFLSGLMMRREVA